MTKATRLKTKEVQNHGTSLFRPSNPNIRYCRPSECSVTAYSSVTISDIVKYRAMPRQKATMVESVLMAESSIHRRVFLRMYKNSRMISDGPAAKAVAMKRIGIMLVFLSLIHISEPTRQ